MAKRSDEAPRKRFSKSGHTRHVPRVPPPAPYYPPQQPPPPPPPPPSYPTEDYYGRPATVPDPYGAPTYHQATNTKERREDTPPSSPAVALTKAAIAGTNRAARTVTRKVVSASKAA